MPPEWGGLDAGGAARDAGYFRPAARQTEDGKAMTRFAPLLLVCLLCGNVRADGQPGRQPSSNYLEIISRSIAKADKNIKSAVNDFATQPNAPRRLMKALFLRALMTETYWESRIFHSMKVLNVYRQCVKP